MLYRNLSTQEEIDAEYNPLLSALDAPSIMEEWASESTRVRRELDGKLGMRYGPTKDEYIDFSYIKITPKELTGSEEFNKLFFKLKLIPSFYSLT